MLDQQTALRKLTEGQIQLLPLKLRLLDTEALAGENRRIDWIVELTWGDESARFGVEYTRVSTPKNLRAALAQLRFLGIAPGPLGRESQSEPEERRLPGMLPSGSAPPSPAPLLPMVMAPYLDPNELDQLLKEEISGIDFCGNGVVIVPGRWLVYRTGQPNRYPSSAPIKQIYQGKSSLVGRLLVLRRALSKVSAVRDEIEEREATITLGTVSKVLKVLEQELIVSREDGIRVIQPDLLIDRLAENYKPPADLERIRGRVPERPDLLKRLTSLAQDKGIKIAVNGSLRYAQTPISDRYLYPPICVEALEELADPIAFQWTERFANIEFWDTRDPLVYFDRRMSDDVWWSSPLQTYLELAQGGARDREFAEGLRVRILEGEFD